MWTLLFWIGVVPDGARDEHVPCSGGRSGPDIDAVIPHAIVGYPHGAEK